MTQKEPDWIAILRADVAATGSITKTADRVGVSRGAISAIIGQTASSHYVSGKCSTAKIERRVMDTIGLIVCPFLSAGYGEEKRITGLECRDTSYRENPPTNSPRAMAHWRACQTCEKRVPGPVAKVTPVAIVKTNAGVSKVPSTIAAASKATGPEEAYQEGWDCIGGPGDNPYPVEDARSDYWDTGFKQRRDKDRELNQKMRARLAKLDAKPADEPQQAGIIDKVTLPLPVIGGPQVARKEVLA